MSEKSKSTTFLLCYALGFLGAHRFYLKRWKTGLLMLLTFGGLTIWWLIDVVLIMGGKLTDANGDELRTGPPDPDNPHAGFWVRAAAISVDLIILQLVMMVVMFVLMFALGLGAAATMAVADPAALAALGPTLNLAILGVLLTIFPLYFGLQHASGHQATVGKRIFAIYVASAAGDKPGLLRSLWRAVCYLFSALPIYLGFVLAAFTKDKRALHDYLAGTKVLYVAEDGVPVASPAPAAIAATSTKAPAPALTESGASTSNTGAKLTMALGAALLAAAAALALM